MHVVIIVVGRPRRQLHVRIRVIAIVPAETTHTAPRTPCPCVGMIAAWRSHGRGDFREA